MLKSNRKKLSNKIAEKQVEVTSYIGKPLVRYASDKNITTREVIDKFHCLGVLGLNFKSILTEKMLSLLNPTEDKVDFNFPDTSHDYIFNMDKKDLFADRKSKLCIFDDLKTESIFTDLEAFTICRGLKNPLPKQLSKRYFAQQYIFQQEIFDAHNFAMEAFHIYGGAFLSYCLVLPPLSYKNTKVLSAFRLLDKIKLPNPVVYFLLSDPHTNRKEKFYIKFGSTLINDRSTINIKNSRNNRIVAVLNRNGTITPKENESFYKSQLDLFIVFLDRGMNGVLAFGLETGICGLCGRVLSTPESVKRGIGPTCAESIGLY